MWGYVVSVATDERIRSTVAEWRPPTPDTLTGVLFLASVVAVVWFTVVHRSRVRWPVLLGLGLFFAIGIVSIRGGVWWFLAAPVLVASIGPGTSERTERADPRGSLNAVLVGVFCVVALVPLLRWIPYRDASPPEGLLTDAPPGITRALVGVLQPGEAFFNAQKWGSWFEFALPDHPVFVDSRFELIPERAWRAYDAVSVESRLAGDPERSRVRRGRPRSRSAGAAAPRDRGRPEVGAHLRGRDRGGVPTLEVELSHSGSRPEIRPAVVAARSAATRERTPSLP